MSAAELHKLMAMLRKHGFDTEASPQTIRQRIDGFAKMYSPAADVRVFPSSVAGLPAERLTAGPGPNVLYLHGGGYVTGSARSHRHVAARLAVELAGTVNLVEYRLAPEAPFPAASDDCLSAYAELATEPLSIIGDSAGGGLAFVTAMRARDAGLPLPRAIVGLSPWVNLETTNEAYELVAPLDPLLSREVAEWHAERYLANGSRTDSKASPLFGDLAGLPPTLIQIGDREVFFGDAMRMHMALLAAGVDAEISVWKAMFHVWHLYWPDLDEGRRALADAARFILDHHEPRAAAT